MPDDTEEFTPWLLLDAEIEQQYRDAENNVWRRMTAEERRRLWDTIQQNHADPMTEAMSELAQLAFFRLVQRTPDLKIGEPS